MSDPSPVQEPGVLEQLKEVKSEAAELRNFTITFLSLLLYVNLIVAGTDAEQILRVAPVTLPLLNVPLPIINFYGFTPWLILLFHLYLLVQHYLFSQKLGALAQAPDTMQAYLRKNLGNLPFLYWMIGRQGRAMQAVLTLITLVCLIFWPLASLLWLQMAILPYHSPELLATQRAAILIDVLLIAWLWPKILSPDNSSRTWWKRGFAIFRGWGKDWEVRHDWPTVKKALCQRWLDLGFALDADLLGVGLLMMLFFSFFVACLPDSWEDKLLSGLPAPYSIPVDVDDNGKPLRSAFYLTARLHEQHAKPGLSEDEYNTLQARGAKSCPHSEPADKPKPDDTHAQKSNTAGQQPTLEIMPCLMVQPVLPRNLILREKVLTADPNLKPELEAKFQAGAETPKPEDFAQIRGLNLQNRNFDYADFTRSSLPEADLRYASLKQSVLFGTRLDHAQMQSTHMENANLSFATLTGADLYHATLTGADLDSATLTGARLYDATLTGANLVQATLTGANLYQATLTGANLGSATLTGAFLLNATLTGADLRLATLTGASLYQATLTGANLSEVTLTGAFLFGATLTGADLRIFTKPLSADDIKASASQLREALAYQSGYHGPQHQSALDERIKQFEQRATQPSNFSKVEKPIKPCLRNPQDENLLPECVTKDALTGPDRQAFTKLWLGLACDSPAIAKRMISRTDDFDWLAQPLLDFAKDGNKCPGWTGLSEQDKARLQEQAAKASAH